MCGVVAWMCVIVLRVICDIFWGLKHQLWDKALDLTLYAYFIDYIFCLKGTVALVASIYVVFEAGFLNTKMILKPKYEALGFMCNLDSMFYKCYFSPTKCSFYWKSSLIVNL